MKISIPELSFVLLIGPSGSGKSTFARAHFKPTEVISSDACRGLVADDENDQSATNDAFELLRYLAGKRLARGRLTVIDATNVQPEARKPLVALAKEHHVLPVAIVFDVPEKLCLDRNASRPDRNFGPHVVRQQVQQLRRSIRSLEREGFRHVWIGSTEELQTAEILRQPMWNDRRFDHGPFDIIGDVHGCAEELERLIAALGYTPDENGVPRHPAGRRIIFLGDLVDRGPAVPRVLELAMRMHAAGAALCVPGNHEMKLLRKLRGKDVKLTHGLAQTVEQLAARPAEFSQSVAEFIDSLVSHYVLDDGKLVVAHAGMKESLQGRGSGRVREFALYGETTGETDEYGLPVRYNWASEYRGRAIVVYGHTPVPESVWLNNTICIDTGCVYGGKLTALRYPERELISVPAGRVYCEPVRPLAPPRVENPLAAQQEHDRLLDIADVIGKRQITNALHFPVTIRDENAAAALEAISRFAADPRWLIYLPPAMAPTSTSPDPSLLEHPAEAFDDYARHGVARVVCEEKHMGSRAICVVARNAAAAAKRFGVEEAGICYTRTGRRFFSEPSLEAELIDRLRGAAERARLFDELATDWLCLDCELMPWSAKAQELLRDQYAAVGAAGGASLSAAVRALETASDPAAAELLRRTRARAENLSRYADAYRRYCWPVRSLADYRLAPFHLLASEGVVHASKDHLWHLAMLARLAREDQALILATEHRVVELADELSRAAGIEWWEALTGRGGEGMVVKPLDFIARGKKGLLQPAIKCRGPEYLRIIYGPDYLMPENLERLRSRSISTKRSLALREFALGIEGLTRFVAKEPLRRVHECVFGVLALESEPVDPRL